MKSSKSQLLIWLPDPQEEPDHQLSSMDTNQPMLKSTNLNTINNNNNLVVATVSTINNNSTIHHTSTEAQERNKTSKFINKTTSINHNWERAILVRVLTSEAHHLEEVNLNINTE